MGSGPILRLRRALLASTACSHALSVPVPRWVREARHD